MEQIPNLVCDIFAVVPLAPGEDKPKRLTKLEREGYSLPADLRDILVGLLLGDLFGQKAGHCVNVRFTFAQGLVHLEYLLYLYGLFSNYCSNEPKIYKVGGVNKAIRFFTYALPCFNELYEIFYPDGKKIVPLNIGELLTALSLAYWISDDGSFNKLYRAVILCTNGFSKEEVNLLINVLNSKWNLDCTINKSGNGFVIRIPSSSLPILQALLKDIMPPMMLYKIGL